MFLFVKKKTLNKQPNNFDLWKKEKQKFCRWYEFIKFDR